MDKCPTCYQDLPLAVDLKVCLDENCLIWRGKRCDLTPNETVVVYVLHKAGREWVHIDRLMASLYGYREHADDAVVRVYFSHIRQKLKTKQIPIQIESAGLRGGGMHKYRLKF